MGFMHGLFRLLARPLRSVAQVVAGLFSSESAVSGGVASRGAAGVAAVRTATAPPWRRFVKWSVISAGLCIYAGLQFALGILINPPDWPWLPAMVRFHGWVYIVAFFVVTGSVAIAAFRPAMAFVLWLILSPFGKRFLYLDIGWLAMPAISFDFIVIYSLAALMLVRAFVNRTKPRRLIWPEWLMIAFALYVGLMEVLSSEQLAFMDLVRYISRIFIPDVLYITVLYFVVKAVIRTREHVRMVLVGMVVFGLLMGLAAFYEHFTGNRWYSLIVGIGLPLKWQDIGRGRASGMFDHPSAPSALTATAFFLAFHLSAWTRRHWARVFYYVCMIVVAIGAYFTYTRNVYFVMTFFLLAVPLAAPFRRTRYVALAGTTAIVALALVPVMLQNPQFHRRITDPTNFYARVTYAQTGLNVIKHHIWTGVGWRKLDRVQKHYVTSLAHHNYRPDERGLGWVNISHNTYLTILAEEGLIGTLLYFGAVGAFLVLLVQTRSRAPADDVLGKDLISILIVSSVAFLISIAFASTYLIPYPNYIFWMQFALVVRLTEMRAEVVQESEQAAEAPPISPKTVTAQAGG